MKNLVFIVLFAVLMVSCASKKFIIMPDYEGQKITKASLKVVLTDEPDIENGDDVADDLGEGVPEDVYFNYLIQKLPNAFRLTSTFKSVIVADTISPFPLEEKILDLNKKEKIKIKVPQIATESTSDSTLDFTLLIQKLRINRFGGSAGTWTGGANGVYVGGSSEKLIQKGIFTIWDNKAERIVSYGRFDSESGFLFAMQKSTWDSGIIQMTKLILKGSPFYKSSRR